MGEHLRTAIAGIRGREAELCPGRRSSRALEVQLALKRMTDITLSAVGLVLCSPALAGCALLVALSSPGPILFRQSRLGLNGRPFSIIKFRTMFLNAPDLRNPDGSTVSATRDSRVTPIGRFLRSTSLDELPQLVNVLAGEMSLIGPRPDQFDQAAFYRPEEREKLSMRPGISGLAQISGRNSISWERRKQLDCDYVRNWSLWLDLKIIAATIPFVLLRRGINSKSAVSD